MRHCTECGDELEPGTVTGRCIYCSSTAAEKDRAIAGMADEIVACLQNAADVLHGMKLSHTLNWQVGDECHALAERLRKLI